MADIGDLTNPSGSSLRFPVPVHVPPGDADVLGRIVALKQSDPSSASPTGILSRSGESGSPEVSKVSRQDPNKGSPRWRASREGVLILIVDVLAVATVVSLGLLIGQQTLWVGIALGLGLVITLFWTHMYRRRIQLSILEDLPKLTLVASASLAVMMMLAAAFPEAPVRLRSGACLVVGLLVARGLSYAMVNRMRRTQRFKSSVVVVGTGSVGRRLGEAISGSPGIGLSLVGFVDDEPLETDPVLPAPILGSVEDFGEVLRRHSPDQVLIAFPQASTQELVHTVRSLDGMDIDVSVVPRFFEMALVFRSRDEIDRVPVIRLQHATRRPMTWPMKRAFDLLLAGVALILLSPLMMILALALRIESGPGVIFRQRRVGVDGHEFELLKFRSLKPADDQESASLWNVHHDDRLTPLGKFIRKTSLDELPQFWNILRGDMSLVGPRPERKFFVDQFTDTVHTYEHRHRVPSGLTGLAQIHGLRGDTSIEERARYDNYYIDNWSIWLDLKIMLRTTTRIMKGSG